MGRVLTSRAAGILIIALLAAGCAPERVEDPASLALQLADLPDGTKEGKRIPVITSDNLKSLHKQKKVSDLVTEELGKLDFEAVVTKTFVLPDGKEVVSQILIFDREKDAIAYFRKKRPTFPAKDPPRLGDESYSEALLSPATNDPEAANLRSLRTRIRKHRVISDVSETGSEVEAQAHYDLARKAEARLVRVDEG